MRHIIRGQPTPAELRAADAALTAHQQKYGDYARSKNSETYQVRVGGRNYSIEVMNRKASYVATVMNHHCSLSKICGTAIEAAGCIVKDGKLLALRQGDNMKEKCLTCGREMSDEPDSLNLNCGGDCLECMASHGDPDCISAVTRIKARKRDAGSNGTEA